MTRSLWRMRSTSPVTCECDDEDGGGDDDDADDGENCDKDTTDRDGAGANFFKLSSADIKHCTHAWTTSASHLNPPQRAIRAMTDGHVTIALALMMQPQHIKWVTTFRHAGPSSHRSFPGNTIGPPVNPTKGKALLLPPSKHLETK